MHRVNDLVIHSLNSRVGTIRVTTEYNKKIFLGGLYWLQFNPPSNTLAHIELFFNDLQVNIDGSKLK